MKVPQVPVSTRARMNLVRFTALLTGLALALGSCGARPSDVIHQERSLYRNIYVKQTGNVRCMAFGVGLTAGSQGCISVRNPSTHMLEYSRLEMAGFYAVPQPKSALVVGLGVGVIPRTMQELYPEARVDVVEIDPAVIKIAASHFGYNAGPNVRIVTDDARRFVRGQLRRNHSYDLIFLDAFNGEYIPEHLVTAEFLTEVKNLLSPIGVVVANTWSNSKLYDSESETYKAVFGNFISLKRANRIILAARDGSLSIAEMTRNAHLLEQKFRTIGVSEDEILPLLDAAPRWNKGAPVLTDQYSPANLLNE